ncbi:MAG: hypothetical protein AB7F50_06905 [Fimbriimonadaceae bacterium]
MTAVGRAAIGALAGSLVVLVSHPVTRPLVFGSLERTANLRFLDTTPALIENIPELAPPETLAETALWLQVGAEYELTGRRLEPKKSAVLAELAAAAAKNDPNNAMWPQAEAAFRWRESGKVDQRVRDSWRQASSRLRWDDFETDRLRPVLEGLRKENGRVLAWHYALAKNNRSEALPILIGRAGLALAPLAENDADASIIQLRNGVLLRGGARTAAGAAEGAALIDRVPVTAGPEPRRLANWRGDLFDRLSATGRGEDAVWAATSFAENDAWHVFVKPIEAHQEFVQTTLYSVVAVAFPSGLILAGAGGLLICALGLATSRSNVRRTPPFAPLVLVAASVGALVYLASGLTFPALWSALVVSSFGVSPDRLKEGAVVVSGAGLSASVWTLAVLVAFTFPLAFLPWTGAGAALATTVAEAGLDVEVLRLALFLELSLVVFVAPVWGFVNRYRGLAVLPKVLQGFGGALAIVALAAAVVLTPFLVVADTNLTEVLYKQFLKEPNYYLTK